MKKDVVGMDRPRSEDRPQYADRDAVLAALEHIDQVGNALAKRVARLEEIADALCLKAPLEQVKVLEERVETLEDENLGLADAYRTLEERVDALERYLPDLLDSNARLLERVAELEKHLEIIYWDTFSEPLPWGDLD